MGERAHALELLPRIPERSLIVANASFVGNDFCQALPKARRSSRPSARRRCRGISTLTVPSTVLISSSGRRALEAQESIGKATPISMATSTATISPSGRRTTGKRCRRSTLPSDPCREATRQMEPGGSDGALVRIGLHGYDERTNLNGVPANIGSDSRQPVPDKRVGASAPTLTPSVMRRTAMPRNTRVESLAHEERAICFRLGWRSQWPGPAAASALQGSGNILSRKWPRFLLWCV